MFNAEMWCIKFKKGIYIIVIVYCTVPCHGTDFVNSKCIANDFKKMKALLHRLKAQLIKQPGTQLLHNIREACYQCSIWLYPQYSYS